MLGRHFVKTYPLVRHRCLAEHGPALAAAALLLHLATLLPPHGWCIEWCETPQGIGLALTGRSLPPCRSQNAKFQWNRRPGPEPLCRERSTSMVRNWLVLQLPWKCSFGPSPKTWEIF